MQVKGKKKILAYILIIVMTAMGMAGCMKSEQTVAIINGEKISEPVYRICLWITQRYFESVTTNIWELDSVDGKTPEEYAKDKALSSLKLSVAAKQKADELGVKLTKADKKQIKELMNKAGFKRTNIPECIYQEDSDIYNQPMFFEIIQEK